MSDRKRYQLSVVGPFYVEDGCCTLCGVPESEARTFSVRTCRNATSRSNPRPPTSSAECCRLLVSRTSAASATLERIGTSWKPSVAGTTCQSWMARPTKQRASRGGPGCERGSPLNAEIDARRERPRTRRAGPTRVWRAFRWGGFSSVTESPPTPSRQGRALRSLFPPAELHPRPTLEERRCAQSACLPDVTVRKAGRGAARNPDVLAWQRRIGALGLITGIPGTTET